MTLPLVRQVQRDFIVETHRPEYLLLEIPDEVLQSVRSMGALRGSGIVRFEFTTKPIFYTENLK